MHVSADIPTKEPIAAVAGTTWKWKRTDLTEHYPASGGWTLDYALRGPGVINVTASADGDNFLVSLAAATTKDYKVGDYWWTARVKKGAEEFEVGSGRLKITINLAASSADTYDGRSHAKKVLDAIEAVLEKTATREQEQYQIAGRALILRKPEELLVLRDRYKAESLREEQAAAIARGEKPKNRILTRFV